jgi:hypothetical protein
LLTQYPGSTVIRYQCSGSLLYRDRACCVMFGGFRADRAVSEQLLQALTPLGIEAALEAMETLQGASHERIRQKRLALDQARYEVTRARRQYDAVDPANRLVAAELERRWNHALTTEAELDADLRSLQQQREEPLTLTAKRELLALAQDLRGLWDHPQVRRPTRSVCCASPCARSSPRVKATPSAWWCIGKAAITRRWSSRRFAPVAIGT